METSDVKRILEHILAENGRDKGFDEIYQKYYMVDDQNKKKEIFAKQLWNYMKNNKYVPEHFESDDDREIITILEFFAGKHNDPLALKYCLVLLHHRFMLSDILEKAYASNILIYIFLNLQDLMKSILAEFISNGLNDRIYAYFFDDDDRDLETLLFEMIRAILPIIHWSMENHPMIIAEDIDNEFLANLQEISDSLNGKKPALPKFSALCRYLYESIHY